ncbi:MAG: bifunctional homocysteine S-methyltransferase/methylenetetrahydrofolate reductase [Chloroflexota bacterium]
MNIVNHPFIQRLQSGPVLLADGAMGTQLYARGIGYEDCFDVQNLDRPDLVEEIHRDYIVAGAELIETNTFGANRARLSAFGLDDKVAEINRRGARLARAAREISGEPVLVAGSVGPTGLSLEPYGSATEHEIEQLFIEQIEALLEGGVDLLVLETFGDLREISQAVQAAKKVSGLPLIAQMTFAEDLRTARGYTAEQVVETLGALGVDVIGANCSVGPNALLQVAEQLIAAGAETVSVMPNAGFPTQVGSRLLYPSAPEYMADFGRRMAEVGARVLGGCCGTTPRHIRALRQVLRSPQISVTPTAVEAIPEFELEGGLEPVSEQSPLALKLGRRRVISVEVRPPRGANPAKALQGARLLKAAGVDAINVLDSAMARVRMSAVASAVLITRQVGVDTILHFTTRDRNLMAIQSDLIGAHALGIRAVLALTGDPPSLGDYAQAKAVYDVDSIGLIRVIKQLNQGADVSGNSIGTPTQFLIGAALNPMAADLGWELDRFSKKIEAGADFAMTQPVYDSELFHRVLERLGPIDIPILMGVLPLQSYRHALFLHNELPGVTLTDDALQRMEVAGNNGVAEGLAMAREMIAECGDRTAGIYIMPSFGRYETAAQLVAELAPAA